MTPVTVVLAGPNRVLQVKTSETDGYRAVQLAFGDQKVGRLTKPQLGHLARMGVATDVKGEGKEQGTLVGVRRIREFRDFPREVKPGELLGVDVFNVGEYVDCIGITKGRGFEGVVGRWSFRGGDMTHGAKGWHRRAGAIGCRLFPGHVNKGQKMPGHMGQDRRTVQNLQIVQVRKDDNVLLIRGSCPGSEGDYIIIREAKKLGSSTKRFKELQERRKKAAADAAKSKAEAEKTRKEEKTAATAAAKAKKK
jgi:large subunit ribosomal protein L3